ncbi:hypothetical protein SEUCBS139899_004413 [Sporothrix eucalyptigena]|uniref:Uncharacterized protein n=1 Tax=Sporothrix eucalyptigena TaxID=1812306 RepID=A0ABP0C657_9PEZI
MPPRGRPPGRKNGASLGAQPQTPGKPLLSPDGTPQTTKGKKKGRPPKGSTRSQSMYAPTVRVASPAPSPAPTPAIVEPPVIIEPPTATEHTDPERFEVTQQPIEVSDHEEVPSPPQNKATGGWYETESADAAEARTVEDNATVEVDGPATPPPPSLASASVPGPRPRGRPPNSTNRNGTRLSYASSSVDLDEIMYRQMGEDIEAYSVDLSFCESQVDANDDLTPQECRMLQLRILDLHHQLRFCKQRRETLEAQRVLRNGKPFKTAATNGARMPVPAGATNGHANRRRSATASGPSKRPRSSHGTDQNGDGPTNKRPRAASEVSVQDTISVHSQETGEARETSVANIDGPSDMEMVHYNGNSRRVSTPDHSVLGNVDSGNHPGNKMQRLGLWYCQLCISEKYLYAGPDRVPSNPSKEIKDMGKLMTHYFDMHREHEPEERCAALGEALAKNRGPFAYWLIKSRAQRIEDPAVLDDAIDELKAGRVPKLLRDLCRAAAAFPATTSN